jgi:hypothetical protein
LKLKWDEPLSSVAFSFNVRRYTVVGKWNLGDVGIVDPEGISAMVGRCSCHTIKPRVESAPGFSA